MDQLDPAVARPAFELGKKGIEAAIEASHQRRAALRAGRPRRKTALKPN
jgi:hypothetical protein